MSALPALRQRGHRGGPPAGGVPRGKAGPVSTRCPSAGPVGAGGSVGDGCALPSAGGGHGAPQRFSAPARPRPPQRPLLAGAGAAPAGRRLPPCPAVRPALRAALRRVGRVGCDKRQLSAVLFRQAHGAALRVRVLARGLAGAHLLVETSVKHAGPSPASIRQTCPLKPPETGRHPQRLQQQCYPTSQPAATTLSRDGTEDVCQNVLQDVVHVH